MATLTSPEGIWLWSLALAAALVWPLRRFIFLLATRRERPPLAEARVRVLRRRATVTAVLIAVFFAATYVHVVAARLIGARG